MDKETEELFKKMAEQFIKLVECNNFLLQENLRLMKVPRISNPNPNTITQGQINYIKRLISEGKIPSGQSLNITKQEAQILISNVVNPNKIAEGHQTLNRTEQTGSEYRETEDLTSKSPDTQDLYKEKEDY